jgi:hypothetical protein
MSVHYSLLFFKCSLFSLSLSTIYNCNTVLFLTIYVAETDKCVDQLTPLSSKKLTCKGTLQAGDTFNIQCVSRGV